MDNIIYFFSNTVADGVKWLFTTIFDNLYNVIIEIGSAFSEKLFEIMDGNAENIFTPAMFCFILGVPLFFSLLNVLISLVKGD